MLPIILRPATLEDADVLLHWRNDPATRQASHNTAAVGYADHVAWLARTLENPTRQLYIAELDGIPVGTVRADNGGADYELSWTVAPEARRKGIGKAMVAALAARLSPIRAEIKVGNQASVRIAESVGMVLEREADGVLYFQRS